MNDDITPAEVIRETWRWWPAALTVGLALIALFTVLSLFIWHIGGVFQAKTIQRNYSNTVSSQPYQQTLVGEMQQHLANISGPGGIAATRASIPAKSPEQENLRAQELAELSAFCSEGTNLQPGSAPGSQDLETVYRSNCIAGTVLAAAPLAPAAT